MEGWEGSVSRGPANRVQQPQASARCGPHHRVGIGGKGGSETAGHSAWPPCTLAKTHVCQIMELQLSWAFSLPQFPTSLTPNTLSYRMGNTLS